MKSLYVKEVEVFLIFPFKFNPKYLYIVCLKPKHPHYDQKMHPL
jgi:hypothetical protein